MTARTVFIEAAYLADVLRRAHLLDGLPWSQMAVVVRTAGALGPLRRALASAGVPVAAALGLDLSALPVGLSPDRRQLADGLRRLTTPDARILLEDPDPAQPGWNWTALLPGLTGRAFLGGLDPDGGIEHLHRRKQLSR